LLQGRCDEAAGKEKKEKKEKKGASSLPKQYDVKSKAVNLAEQESADDEDSDDSSRSDNGDIKPPTLPMYNCTAMASIACALEDLSFNNDDRHSHLLMAMHDNSDDDTCFSTENGEAQEPDLLRIPNGDTNGGKGETCMDDKQASLLSGGTAKSVLQV
jgi:hypothetical protein